MSTYLELKKLSEVISIVKGKKPHNLELDNSKYSVPYINIQAFEKKIFSQYTDNKDSRSCNADDILIVWDGARCGLVGRGVAGAIGSTLAKIETNVLTSSFVYYFLQLQYETINKNPRGIGIPHIDPNLFWNIEIPVFPEPEQERIVERIESLFTQLDAGVAGLKRAHITLKRYTASVLKAACEGKLLNPENKVLELGEGILPDGWRWMEAEQVCEFITKGTTPKSDKLSFGSGEIPFIKVYNLTFDGSLDFTANPTFVKRHTHCGELARSKVLPGDVLMNIVGPPLGKVSIVPDTYPEWNINQAIARFRPLSDCDVNYLAIVLRSDNTLKWATKRAKATAGQFNLTLEICRELPIPFPSIIEQRRIVAEVERRLSVTQAMRKNIKTNLKRSERLRHVILKRAFEGRLI
jgi:type I restriction enzyme S subunit